MIKTICVCDRCAAEQETRNQFWTIGVWASHNGEAYNESLKEHKRSIQVCRNCLEALGVNVTRETAAKANYVERTTEDILRELIERVQC